MGHEDRFPSYEFREKCVHKGQPRAKSPRLSLKSSLRLRQPRLPYPTWLQEACEDGTGVAAKAGFAVEPSVSAVSSLCYLAWDIRGSARLSAQASHRTPRRESARCGGGGAPRPP